MFDGRSQLKLQGAVLKGRVVGRPRDDRQPDVFGQLHEVLAGDSLAAVVLAVGQVQNGGGFVGWKKSQNFTLLKWSPEKGIISTCLFTS